jgi:hypothetical protein
VGPQKLRPGRIDFQDLTPQVKGKKTDRNKFKQVLVSSVEFLFHESPQMILEFGFSILDLFDMLFLLYNKRWSATRRKRLRCASETITLGILAHFSHFRHF